ncbi:uncharacterized protein METZ01_LOCUS336686, partial [marine metagenome]
QRNGHGKYPWSDIRRYVNIPIQAPTEIFISARPQRSIRPRL